MFTFIPAGGSGDFNVDLRDVRVAITVVLKNNKDVLTMEHFKGNISFRMVTVLMVVIMAILESIRDSRIMVMVKENCLR